MIIDLPSTTTSQVNSKLVQLREEGGAVTLGRVLTLVIVTDDGAKTEDAVDAANDASREHPCRVIVVARGARKAAPRLDAQIRVGGDAGASEVIVLRLYGELANEGASCVVPLLLPDTPVVAWWPNEAPPVPAEDPIGQLAQRRITDAAAEKNPIKALEQRRASYTPGDTDLAWTRLTLWRAMIASAFDLPPYEKVTEAEVSGESDSPSTDLLAAWLAAYLKVPVKRSKAARGEGIVDVRLERRSGVVELARPDGKVGTLSQPGQPERRVALQRRQVRDCLAEELRRLDPDEVYETALKALGKVVRGRTAVKSTAAARKQAPATAPATPDAGATSSGPSPKAAPVKATAKAAAPKTATPKGSAPKGAAPKAASPKAKSDGAAEPKAAKSRTKASKSKAGS
ncbi:glucose-6-phosphate dehydrogenase assembly protein OpcA [Saccharothrix longispora]|uniref:glucose-6-phosphate dehydrogenase assembly protein OpcA n=1 Tax=Saccharothrix longispora TaxID=33920 RepID=UPI0028FD1CF2|nr:glucose-6-phosphate dehydrogenase assembly protein OpcA [Saccharothrix longispora]MBY8849215.1 glucose-6-phosphate dehydrogenase assembly protein OpcA [Saccharothrix sp. MB29]MDU0290355.1 glucose-6-phosphate dehydrogenase assembly protein OpcA [Saccharothrix longispora]